ncbi:MAG: hypothetical protein R3272_04890 [Candidatus Promineifilaceae bacterium]|nr:hypothetical protein [Candidatus Promineifilaceae bacterium]
MRAVSPGASVTLEGTVDVSAQPALEYASSSRAFVAQGEGSVCRATGKRLAFRATGVETLDAYYCRLHPLEWPVR